MGPRIKKAIIQLQRSVDDLGPPVLLDGRSYNLPCDLKRFGFMVIPNFIDVEMIRAADMSTMKKNFLQNPKFRYVFNDKTRPKESQGTGQRLQIITRTQETEDPIALSTFSEEQRLLLSRCQELVKLKAQELLNTTQTIELVESILLSKGKSRVKQELHPDLDKDYVSKAVLAFISFEDHTTIIICPRSHDQKDVAQHDRETSRYGLAAGSALFFHPLLVHAGDSYVKSNIRLHYYAFLKGTMWEPDSRYELESNVAQRLTREPEVLSKTSKKKIKLREASEERMTLKRQKGEQIGINFVVGKSVKTAAARVANEYTSECVENELASHLNELE